ncbi:MAG: SUMF1/EgtB/PvdO family nonheme iron enzyme [Calothrix sp. MO_192.B10]|nr:SUMF1/EgtB/PvdO family nonheme iron enzyme [Calothrix sp. MO_192.B10]
MDDLLKHLEEQLQEDFNLLKQLEDACRYERDPILKRKYENDIETKKQEIQTRKEEISLKQEEISLRQEKPEVIEPQNTTKTQEKIYRRKLLKLTGLGGTGLVTAGVAHKIICYLSPKIWLPTFNFETVTVDARGNITNRYNREAKFLKEDLGNGVTLEMVYIRGGTFMMGTEDEEIERLIQKFQSVYKSDAKDWFRRERPQHQVKLQPFYIGKYQVTQAQWRAVAAFDRVNRDLNPNPSCFKGDNRPVEIISWDDAVEFCSRLSKYTNRSYRLPSEAEWEYACRAGTNTPFHFGETITDKLANYAASSSTFANERKGKSQGGTTPVGKFPPNAFGLYDMHGNVWEWCQDTRHDNYNNAPTDGSAWIGNDDSSRMLRGGSWNSFPGLCRSASRISKYSKVSNNSLCDPKDIKNSLYGFRVVCS